MFLERSKKSAKGTTKAAQKHLHHDAFKKTLLTREMVRVENVRINSKDHVIHTITVNKLGLSGYDDKRYINADNVTTLPFGHYSLREMMFCNMMFEESPEWGLEESGPNEDMCFSPIADPIPAEDIPSTSNYNLEGWRTPDMGMCQREYSDSELSADLVDFNESTDVSDEEVEENPFIIFEAAEVSEDDLGGSREEEIDRGNRGKRRIERSQGGKTKSKRRAVIESDSD